MKNTTEACLAAGGVKPPKSGKRLFPHGVAPANIVTVIQLYNKYILFELFI
jgi:hypothetical protein